MMMARKKNRKRQAEGSLLPIKLVSVLIVAAVVSLSYLWLHGRCEALGSQIKALELQKVELQKHKVNEESKWASLKSPRHIEVLLQRHNLVMAWPEEGRIVRLHRGSLRAPASVLLAQKPAGSAPFVVTMND